MLVTRPSQFYTSTYYVKEHFSKNINFNFAAIRFDNNLWDEYKTLCYGTYVNHFTFTFVDFLCEETCHFILTIYNLVLAANLNLTLFGP